MTQNNSGQIQLSKLIFTQNWEDPAIDERVLNISKEDSIFTITSGCCNTLGFLRFAPKTIHCVDINPAQTYLMELKMAAIRKLDYHSFIGFMGLTEENNRIRIFDMLKNELSAEANAFWKNNLNIVRDGFIMNGRYEKFVKIAGWLLRNIQGVHKTKRFFTLETLKEQSEYFSSRWDNSRWHFIFNTMFNKKRLAKRGLNVDYFHFDDGSTSFSESFRKRAAHAFTELPLKSNYFLALYMLGRYLDINHVPEYLKEKNFDAIQKNINALHPTTADSKYWLEKQSDNIFTGFALSNICELMDENDTHKLFEEVIRTAKPNARIIFRNLMIPREIPADLQKHIVKDVELSKELQFNDRSFVYGKVAAYTVHK